MTEVQRKEMARAILRDIHDDSFTQYSSSELYDFYNENRKSFVIPATASCARDEARRILENEEATNITKKHCKTKGD